MSKSITDKKLRKSAWFFPATPTTTTPFDVFSSSMYLLTRSIEKQQTTLFFEISDLSPIVNSPPLSFFFSVTFHHSDKRWIETIDARSSIVFSRVPGR